MISYLRAWRQCRENCFAVVSTSVSHPAATLMGSIRATMLAMRFLIEPIGPNASRLTVLNRMDIRLDFIVLIINLSILFNQVYKFDNFILTLKSQSIQPFCYNLYCFKHINTVVCITTAIIFCFKSCRMFICCNFLAPLSILGLDKFLFCLSENQALSS